MTDSRPGPADASPEELVQRSSQGDLAAFARIVRVHHTDMTRVAFVVTGDLDGAARATHAAWPAAWNGVRHPRIPESLDPWLCALAADEAVDAARRHRTHAVDEADGFGSGPPADGGVGAAPASADDPIASAASSSAEAGLLRAIAGLDPEDRALLALHHVAGVSVRDLARRHPRSGSRVEARLARLAAEVDGGPAVGSDQRGVGERLGQRLRAAARVPVDPVDADAAARWARADVAEERTRQISIAVSAVAGLLVAGFPYLAELLHRRFS